MNEIQEQVTVVRVRTSGRPRLYSTPEEMQIVIDTYFETTEKVTVTGLALHLGFNSRQSLLNYEGYSEEFLDTMKRAKSRVEAYYEEHLVGNNAAGSIFALKNFGWTDKHEQEITSSFTFIKALSMATNNNCDD